MRRVLFASLAVWIACSPLAAQAPKGSAILGAAAIADSLAVLKTLDSAIAKNPQDAAAWYRRGMVAWVLYERDRSEPPIAGLDWTTLGRLADTSLRIAVQLDEGNTRYRLMAGRFLLGSGVAVTRLAAEPFFESAVDAARKSGDKPLFAETAIEYGRLLWRRYDALANRRMEVVPGTGIRSVREGAYPCLKATPPCGGTSPLSPPIPPPLSAMVIKDGILSGSIELQGEGNDYFAGASALFQEAYAADPTNPRAVRSVAMVLAERSQWRDLATFARRHVGQQPQDAWGWLSLGLATHRLGDNVTASASFDSALKHLDVRDRARLERIDRVLPPADSARRSSGSAAERAAYQRLYWAMSDPLWSRGGNESHTEYLARVTFAELRWTVDELGVRGADSDRGDIYIRYGPPSFVAAFGAQAGSTGSNPLDAITLTTIWEYDAGLMFVFIGQPTFATARIARDDENTVQAIRQAQPARWDNIALPSVDKMPLQTARFRGGRDSVDLLLATAFNVEPIRASATTRSAVRGDLWLLNGSAGVAWRDSVIPATDGVRTWTRRVAPGAYIAHIEASSEYATRASRAAGVVDASGNASGGFGLYGFGISDLLITTRAEPRAGVAKRWSELDVVPVVGALRHGAPVTLVWENYGLGAKGGNAHYEVVVTLSRQQSLAGRIAASITGALARVARVDRGDDRVAISFERTVPHAPAFVDYVTVALNSTPAGQYTLSLQITDRVSGKVVTRTQGVEIREE